MPSCYALVRIADDYRSYFSNVFVLLPGQQITTAAGQSTAISTTGYDEFPPG